MMTFFPVDIKPISGGSGVLCLIRAIQNQMRHQEVARERPVFAVHHGKKSAYIKNSLGSLTFGRCATCLNHWDSSVNGQRLLSFARFTNALQVLFSSSILRYTPGGMLQ